jgi:predicted DsbA family dithiol-disulfide isomerase
MTLPAFSVNWEYRCPFARNVHEHLVTALEGGAKWDVAFVPFSLSQAHVAEGGTPVWEDPTKAADLTALAAGVVVRDRYPDQFLAAHRALFAARHDEGQDLRDPDVVRRVLESSGVPATEVFAAIEEGWPIKEIRSSHEHAVGDLGVFGVPTFVVGEATVFVRIMTRPAGDADLAISTIERVVRHIVEEPDLNEFKHTRIAR